MNTPKSFRVEVIYSCFVDAIAMDRTEALDLAYDETDPLDLSPQRDRSGAHEQVTFDDDTGLVSDAAQVWRDSRPYFSGDLSWTGVIAKEMEWEAERKRVDALQERIPGMETGA